MDRLGDVMFVRISLGVTRGTAFLTLGLRIREVARYESTSYCESEEPQLAAFSDRVAEGDPEVDRCGEAIARAHWRSSRAIQSARRLA
jgi:hypothetical protein